MLQKRTQRSILLQFVYAWNIYNWEDEFSLKDNIDHFFSIFFDISIEGEEKEYFFQTLNSLHKKREEIDIVIQKALKDWSFDRLSFVDKSILQLSLYELIFVEQEKRPHGKVIINEAVELAKKFSDTNSYRFINGILGFVYRNLDLEEEEKVLDKEFIETERKVAALVYTKDEEKNIYLGLVHDVFGYWTLSKGSVEEGKDEKESLKQIVKEETNWDIEPLVLIGESEYIAYPPEKGAVKKHVRYYLARSEYTHPKVLKESGGIDDARWFPLEEISELTMYDDVLKIIMNGLQEIAKIEKREL